MLQGNEVVIKSNLFTNLKAETSVNSGNWIVKNASTGIQTEFSALSLQSRTCIEHSHISTLRFPNLIFVYVREEPSAS